MPTSGILRYLNDIDKLLSLTPSVTTVEQFLDLQHLDDALAVRAAYQIRTLMKKLKSSQEKKVITINDLYAQDITIMSRAHFTYLSFVIYKDIIFTTSFNDQRSKDLLILLAKIYVLKQLSLDC